MPRRSTRGALAWAEGGRRALDEWLARTAPDVLFGCFVSPLLVRADLPIVYFSDTTARILMHTYTRYSSRGAPFAATREAHERRALERATIAAFASQAGAHSAVRDYGRDPARTHAVPMGAHVTPAPDRAAALDPRPPTRRDLELCIVGTDPRRKRLDLAVEACERLRRDGYHARLNVIGPSTARSRRSPAVRLAGRLTLGADHDRRRHEDILERSHFMILPSLGEAYGIAPCEAAHFGRPSIVSDAGGLPTAVLDGVTGVVLPTSAGPGAYARAIEGLVDDPELYRAMSAAALDRARTVLNWDAWGDRIAQLLVAAHQSFRRTPLPA
jgi:glycosyltransferase involved in cell wall biosynthesis